jgi:hypothetical protein
VGFHSEALLWFLDFKINGYVWNIHEPEIDKLFLNRKTINGIRWESN